MRVIQALCFALLFAACDHPIQVGEPDGGVDGGVDAGLPTRKPFNTFPTVTPGVKSLTVTWDAQPGKNAPTKWHLMRATESFQDWSSSLLGAEDHTIATCCSFTFENLTPGETSYIEVAGINALGEGAGAVIAGTPVALVTSWTTLSDLPTPRYDLAAAGLDGKLYVVGGLTPSLANTLEVFDPATGQWAAKAPMPTPRSGLAAAGINGKLYAIGGYEANNTSSSKVEEYDPLNDSWRARSPLPPPATSCHGQALAATIASTVYVAIGECNELYAYDALNDSWSTLAPGGGCLESIVYGLAALEGDLYTMCNTQYYVYQPAANTWTLQTPLAAPPFPSTVMLASASGHLLGVRSDVNNQNEVWYLDPASGVSTWVALPQVTLDRDRYAITTVDDVIYIVGGSQLPAQPGVYLPLSALEAGRVLP